MSTPNANGPTRRDFALALRHVEAARTALSLLCNYPWLSDDSFDARGEAASACARLAQTIERDMLQAEDSK